MRMQVRQLRASKQAQAAAPPPQALGPAGSLSQGSMLPGGAAAMAMAGGAGGPDASALFAAMLQRLPQQGMHGARWPPLQSFASLMHCISRTRDVRMPLLVQRMLLSLGHSWGCVQCQEVLQL